MYSPDGEEVTANNKEEHEKFSAKGYSHEKPVEESPEEPKAKGEKEFKGKHTIKKSGMNTDGTNVKEGKVVYLNDPDEAELSPKQKKYQAFFQKALKKFGVKSPSELEGDKKKEFFDYIDKNYDAGEGEEDEQEIKKPKKEEVTITIPAKFIAEKKVTVDVDWMGDPGPTKAAEKKYKVKIKIGTGKRLGQADITGDNKAIVKLLTDPDIYGWPKADVLDVWPKLK